MHFLPLEPIVRLLELNLLRHNYRITLRVNYIYALIVLLAESEKNVTNKAGKGCLPCGLMDAMLVQLGFNVKQQPQPEQQRNIRLPKGWQVLLL